MAHPTGGTFTLHGIPQYIGGINDELDEIAQVAADRGIGQPSDMLEGTFRVAGDGSYALDPDTVRVVES